MKALQHQSSIDYPVTCGDNQASPFAMQLLLADAQADCQIITVANLPTELPIGKITLADKRVIFAIHPPPPINAQLAETRIAYLSKVAELINQETSPVMVIGDMNTSAFSPIYRDFISATGLQNNPLQRTTVNALPTWMPFFLSIDHVLTNHISHPLTIQPLDWRGSDHRGFRIRW